MKNFKNIIKRISGYLTLVVLVLFIGFIQACNEDEFLDVQPKGALSGDALASKYGVEGLVISGYAALAQHFQDQPGMGLSFFYAGSNWTYSDVRSGDIYKGGDGVGDIAILHNIEVCNITPDNDLLNLKWRAMYIGIGRTNQAITYLKKTDPNEMPERDSRIGEMLTIRSAFYMDLLRIFKQVPYITDATVDPTKVSNTEFTNEQLWNKVISDLNEASNLLPKTQADIGRVTQYVAQAYLAKAYIYNKQWAKAIEASDILIGSNLFSLYPDLELMWEAENEHAGEYVFAVEQSIKDNSTEGHINWGNLLNTPRGPAYAGDNFVRPSQNLVNAFKTDANGLPLLDNYNDVILADSDNVDPRLDHYIGRLEIPWKTFGKVYDKKWIRNTVDYGTYCMKKLITTPTSIHMIQKKWPWGGSAANFPLIRYAEVLLWKAEALIELNQNLDEARLLINQVRNRAKNSTYVQKLDGSGDAANYLVNEYPAGASWTQDYARKALRYERRIELCMEGHRFFDLVRWGIAAEELNNYYASEPNFGNAAYLNGVNFKKNMFEFLPIPQPQIDLSNGVYKQLPEYQ